MLLQEEEEEEEEKEEEKHGQNGKIIFMCNFLISLSFTEIFGILFILHIVSAIKLLKAQMT